MNYFRRKEKRALMAAPLASAENALELVARFNSESALTDNRRLQHLFLSAAAATNDQIALTATGTSAFQSCLAQCRQIDNLATGIAEARASQDVLRSRLGLASAFQTANNSMIENIEGTIGLAGERLSKLKSIADMCLSGANELEVRRSQSQRPGGDHGRDASDAAQLSATCEDVGVSLRHALQVAEESRQRAVALQEELDKLFAAAESEREALATLRVHAEWREPLCDLLQAVQPLAGCRSKPGHDPGDLEATSMMSASLMTM